MKIAIIYLSTLLLLVFSASAQEGKITQIQVHSKSLEGNLVGDSPDRNVSIYLPRGYDRQQTKRYPVVYLLHGFSGNKTGANDWEWAFSAEDVNKVIASGMVRPMIIVMPDACNQFGGSMYTNSITTGFWEDFITKDLIDFVDSNYRSIPNRESRGIAGFSMGGYGAIKIAMKHSDIYRSVYANSSCCLDHNPSESRTTEVMKAMSVVNLDSIRNASFSTKIYLATAASFSPNPENPPFFADFPFRMTGDSLSVDENVKARWLSNYPAWMADQYVTNLNELHAISFDAGTNEPGTLKRSQHFSDILNRIQVKHFFEEFDGRHGDKFGERFETKILPFFSNELISDK